MRSVEPGPDLQDTRAQVVRVTLLGEERAVQWIGEQSRTRNRRRGIEHELVVVEIACERLEIFPRSGHAFVDACAGSSEDQPERDREVAPPLRSCILQGPRPDLVDEVGITLAGDAVDEIPAMDRGGDTENAARQAAEEQRQRERRVDEGRGQACREEEGGEAEAFPLRLPQLVQLSFGLLDRACIHATRIGLAPVGGVRAAADFSAGKPQPGIRRSADAARAVRSETQSMNQILIATDGSDSGREALDYGLDLARSSHATATVVYVRRAPRPIVGDPFYQRELTEGLHRADDALAAAARTAGEFGVQAELEILEGDPATQIIEFARARHVDLIVLGSRNRGPLVSALLGSVSKDVVAHADRPVLVAHGSRRAPARRGNRLATV